MKPYDFITTLPEQYRSSDILRLSQEAAVRHVEVLGLAGVAEAQGLAWVIIRVRCELLAPLHPGEVRVETWPGETKNGMMPRYCRIYNADGQLAAQLVTIWVLADVQTRQMRPDAPIAVPAMLQGYEPPMPRGLPRKNMPQTGSFLVTPQQIDGNGHMNNACYLDAAEDAIGGVQGLLRGFAVDYRAEILPGAEVAVFSKQEEGLLLLSGKCGEKEHFRMTLQYQ